MTIKFPLWRIISIFFFATSSLVQRMNMHLFPKNALNCLLLLLFNVTTRNVLKCIKLLKNCSEHFRKTKYSNANEDWKQWRFFTIINIKMGIFGLNNVSSKPQYNIIKCHTSHRVPCYYCVVSALLLLLAGWLCVCVVSSDHNATIATISATVAENRNKTKIIVNFPLRLSAEFVCAAQVSQLVRRKR